MEKNQTLKTIVYTKNSGLKTYIGRYRFGFNGQEKDNEISGDGNSYTAEGWQYDARLGRRWNLDAVYKSDHSNYSAFRNNPIIMVDPDGNEDYYNRKGQFIGSVGENNGVIRVVDSQKSFDKAQSTNEHQGRTITVDSRTINTVLIIVSASSHNTGKEYVANIIFDPDKATITAEIDYDATGNSKESYPENKTSFDSRNGGKVLIGVVHGHPELTETKRTVDANGNARTTFSNNNQTTSPADRTYADDNNIADYALDAFFIEQTDAFSGTGHIHRANPDGSFNDGIAQLKDATSGKFNIGKDALETTGAKPQ